MRESVSQLRDSVLKSLSYSPDAREMQVFLQTYNGLSAIANLRGVVHVSVSNLIEIGYPDILDVSVEPLADGGQRALRELGYLMHGQDRRDIAYPETPLSLVSFEGGTCMAVVCREFNLVEG